MSIKKSLLTIAIITSCTLSTNIYSMQRYKTVQADAVRKIHTEPFYHAVPCYNHKKKKQKVTAAPLSPQDQARLELRKVACAQIELDQKQIAESLELLKKNTVSIDELRSGETLLTSAASSSNFATAQMLLKHGASPNAQDGNGNTALMYAVLLMQPNDFIKRNKGYKTQQALEAHTKAATDLIKALIQAKTDLNIRNKKDETALCLAIKHEQHGIVADLLEAGADPELAGSAKITQEESKKS